MNLTIYFTLQKINNNQELEKIIELSEQHIDKINKQTKIISIYENKIKILEKYYKENTRLSSFNCTKYEQNNGGDRERETYLKSCLFENIYFYNGEFYYVYKDGIDNIDDLKKKFKVQVKNIILIIIIIIKI
jgi:hypothetical protein